MAETTSDKFPCLAKLQTQYLSATESNVYAERLFSEAENVNEMKSNKLLPKMSLHSPQSSTPKF